MYFDLHHESMTTLASLMSETKNEHVKLKTAVALAGLTKAPGKIEDTPDKDGKGHDPIDLISTALDALAEKQIKAIKDGVSITEASKVIIDANIIE